MNEEKKRTTTERKTSAKIYSQIPAIRMGLLSPIPLNYDNEDTKRRLFLLYITSCLTLLSILLLLLMPYKLFGERTDNQMERSAIFFISLVLLAISPLAIIALIVNHEKVNNSKLLFIVGVGSGCLCAITASMIFVNILLTIIDIISGKFRVFVMEIISTNILMIFLTIILYIEASLSRQIQLNCDISSNSNSNNNCNNENTVSRNTSNSYDFNTDNSFEIPKSDVTVIPNLRIV